MTEKKKKNKPEKNKRPTGDISLHVDSRQHDRYNRLHHHKSGKSITFWYIFPHRQVENILLCATLSLARSRLVIVSTWTAYSNTELADKLPSAGKTTT